ncbi:27014_t:CDS:2, partial [Racocetra persica]
MNKAIKDPVINSKQLTRTSEAAAVAAEGIKKNSVIVGILINQKLKMYTHDLTLGAALTGPSAPEVAGPLEFKAGRLDDDGPGDGGLVGPVGIVPDGAGPAGSIGASEGAVGPAGIVSDGAGPVDSVGAPEGATVGPT